jgi:hypothetical protein
MEAVFSCPDNAHVGLSGIAGAVEKEPALLLVRDVGLTEHIRLKNPAAPALCLAQISGAPTPFHRIWDLCKFWENRPGHRICRFIIKSLDYSVAIHPFGIRVGKSIRNADPDEYFFQISPRDDVIA